MHPAERAARILGATFAVWIMVLLYFAINGKWPAFGVSMLVGAAILLVARSISRGGMEMR